AGGSPYGYVRFDGTNVVVFRGTDNYIYEAAWNGSTWSTLLLPGQLLKATGDPLAYNRGTTASVIYKCADVICELRLMASGWKFRVITPLAPLAGYTMPVPFKRLYAPPNALPEYLIFYVGSDGLHMLRDNTEPGFGGVADFLVY